MTPTPRINRTPRSVTRMVNRLQVLELILRKRGVHGRLWGDLCLSINSLTSEDPWVRRCPKSFANAETTVQRVTAALA